jgi:hypothetical protein
MVWRPSGGYKPTTPYGGDGNYVFDGLNFFIKGTSDRLYLEAYNGDLDLSESVPVTNLTGTFASTAGNSLITGTGTKFTEELIMSQGFLVDAKLYSVVEVLSNTSVRVSPTPTVTTSGASGFIPHILMDVDNMRGTLARGSIVRFPKGNLLVVGQGQVRLNGATIPAGGITASRRLQLAVFDPATSNYSVFKLGMQTPVLTTVTAVGSGTKNMQAGTYSIRITPARTSTDGENNPSNKVEVTLATGDMIRVTFPAMDTTAGQDAWNVYGSLFSTGTGIQGPWFFVQQVTTSQVSSAGGSTVDIEYNDAEISGNAILQFDNDPPPDAAFCASLQGVPVLVSTNGPGRVLTGTAATTAGDPTVTGTTTAWTSDMAMGQEIIIGGKPYTVLTVTSNTSIEVEPTPIANASGLTVQLGNTCPGPTIRPAKFDNIEAFPADFAVSVSPPEHILGVREANGRLFLMTQNRLHMATLTGSPDLPVSVRPFWRSGFRNSESLVIANGALYAFTTNGATRSIADGDQGIEEYRFAADVASIMEGWPPENVKVAHDPVNEAIIFFCPNLAEGIFFSTQALAYMLRLDIWSPLIVVNSTIGNDNVTGVATIAGKLYLTYAQKNWLWDAGVVPPTEDPFIKTPFMDFGAPEYDKDIRGVGAIAHANSGFVSCDIYSAKVGDNIATVPTSFTQNFALTTGVAQLEYLKTNIRRSRLAAVQIRCPHEPANDPPSRIDEIVMDVMVRKNTY